MSPKWNSPLETSVKESILSYLDGLDGAVAWKHFGGRMSGGGMPDVFVIRAVEWEVTVYAFEVKRPGTARKKLAPDLEGRELWLAQGATELQAETLERLQRVGARCYVVESVAQVRSIMQYYEERDWDNR